jgi:hypothetical protein
VPDSSARSPRNPWACGLDKVSDKALDCGEVCLNHADDFRFVLLQVEVVQAADKRAAGEVGLPEPFLESVEQRQDLCLRAVVPVYVLVQEREPIRNSL